MNIGFMYFPVYHETGTEDQYRLVLEIRDVDGYRPPRTSLIYKLDGTLSAYVEDYYGFTKLHRYNEVSDVMDLDSIIEKEKENLIELVAGTTDHDSEEYVYYKRIIEFRHEYIRSGR
jgi:hypothetical protein